MLGKICCVGRSLLQNELVIDFVSQSVNFTSITSAMENISLGAAQARHE